MILPDLLKHNLEVVFCGTAAGNKSAEKRAYYAGAGNLFYSTLASYGFTPRIFKPQEYSELLNYGIGLTDLVKHHFGMDRDLALHQFDVEGFREKILNFQPAIICFNGKEAAKVFFGLKHTKQVAYGLQPQIVGRTKLYVAPSTSLQAIAYWDEDIWHQLKGLINK